MTNKRILITGGAGLIGSHIADLLSRRSAGRDRRPRQLRPRPPREPRRRAMQRAASTIVEGDIRDRRCWSTSDATASTSCSTRRRSASPSAPRSRAWRSRCWSTAPSTCSRRRCRPASRRSSPPRRPRSTGWPRRSRPTETHHPYNNRTLYGAAKAFNEGLLRSFNDMYGLTTWRCATSTSTGRAWTSTAPTPRC